MARPHSPPHRPKLPHRVAWRLPAHQRYSRFVRLMKILLPSLAAVLLALVVVWPKLMDDERFRIGFAKLSSSQVESLAMVNARYFGMDSHNRPFTVTAVTATQETRGSDVVVLADPRADFTSNSGASVLVESQRGFYHQKTQMLDLEGEVNLFHENGYEMHTSRATVNLKRSTVQGNAPVEGQGPAGTLSGAGFEIRDQGREVVVTGSSRMILKGASSK